jgi:hypothetical protein
VIVARLRYVSLTAIAVVLLGISPAVAERPSAAKLLPASTVGYFRIANVPDLVEKFGKTSIGRLSQDAQVRPLLSQLYGSAAEAFSQVEEQIGVSLDDLLKIPQGEAAVALVAPEDDSPSLVILFDVGDQLPSVQKLLDQGEAAAVRDGATISTEQVGDVELRIIQAPGERRPPLYFVRDGTVVMSNSLPLAKQMLDVWDGGEGETLLDNAKFTTIMKRCLASEEEPPQITWFIDPIELAIAVTRGNFNAQATVALMPVLGLDKVKGAGGAVTFGTGDFEAITHVHLMLEPPREGVVEMLALGSGKTTPETFIPANAANYATIHWDAKKTYEAAQKVYDRFRQEGELARRMQERVARRYPDLNFEKDLLDAFGGRLTWASWMEPPARINSQSNLVGIKLNDPQEFGDTLETLIAPIRENLEKDTYAGMSYYRVEPPGGRNQNQAAGGNNGPGVRLPTPCFGIVGDYLLITDSEKFFQEAILTRSDPSRGLASALDYKLIASKISRQPGGDNPGLISFRRPEEAIRNLYEIAASQQTRDWLGRQSDNNRALKALDQALKDNPLPPFAVVQKYLAPGGSMLVNEETGFHYLGFSLKRE